MSRLGRLSLGVAVAAGAVLGVTQITSGANNSTKESVFVGLVPARLLDTREDQTTFDGFDQAVGRLDADTTYELDIAGRAGIPTDALSVTANLVAVNPSGPGYLTVYPCGFDKPLAAALNYMPGVNNANEFSVPIGEYGDICIYTLAETDIVVDIYGYYIAGSGTEGPQGPAGPAGPEGPVGTGITVKGTLPNNAAGPPSFDGTDTGDVWIDVNNEAWVWTEQDAWDDAGNIQGPAGADGADGQDGMSPARVIWVADDNTGDFTKLSDALASITDASATKPYVIKIAPGVYTETETVVLKNHIDVEGSGQGITIIECECSTDLISPDLHLGAVVQAGAQSSGSGSGCTGNSGEIDPDDPDRYCTVGVGVIAEIRHLTINNTGGGKKYAYGVWAEGPGLYQSARLFSMLHVTATAGGADSNYGVALKSRAVTQVTHVTATATGGNSSTGVDIGGSASPTLNHVTATATNGTNNKGIFVQTSNATMNNVTATGTGGTSNQGINQSSLGITTILNSSFTGSTYSIYALDSLAGFEASADIANTTLDGPVYGSGLSCIAVRDADFDERNANCQEN